MGQPTFKIVTPVYNGIEYLVQALESVINQDYGHYDIHIIDDASTDGRIPLLTESYCKGRENWSYQFNQTNRGAMYNIVAALDFLEPESDDVIVLLGGDDWLAVPNALSKIAEVYQSPSVYSAYSQHLVYPYMCKGNGEHIPASVVAANSYRQHPWIYSHVRTFRGKVWKEIAREHFLDPLTGDYWHVTSDAAILFPILEMSAERTRFIPDILYVYNRGNPLCDAEIRGKEQLEAAERIRAMAPYTRL